MASNAVDVGYGLTIVFGTSSFSAQILDVSMSGLSREVFDTSHMGTGAPGSNQLNNKTFIPSELVDGGELSFDIHFNPDTEPPLADAVETVTITWNGGATWAFSGAMTSYEPGAPLDGKMTASVRVKVCGPITVTAAV